MTDFRDDRAIYLQMADRICDDILYGKYTAGERVPSVRELSVMLGVNANTVVRTYDALTSDGIIQTRRGLGYFVTDDARDRILSVRRKRFLEETFQIIRQRDSFFRKSHIRIIQCDNQVHADTVIESEEDIARLLKDFSLIGGGGTDFRPAFAYVNRLLDEGVFHNLRGLLYFTDGKGIYPAKRPPYETAFIFIDEPAARQDTAGSVVSSASGKSENAAGITDPMPEVPAWAMRIHLDEDTF